MRREASALMDKIGPVATLSILSGSLYANFFSSLPLHVGFWKLFVVWFVVSWFFGAALSAGCTASAVLLSARAIGTTRGAHGPVLIALAIAAVAGWFVGLFATKLLA